MYRDTKNVEHEMCDSTRGNWCHRNRNTRFKEQFRSRTGKTLNRSASKGDCTWNITRNRGNSAV
jgi:hypothetical protein